MVLLVEKEATSSPVRSTRPTGSGRRLTPGRKKGKILTRITTKAKREEEEVVGAWVVQASLPKVACHSLT